MAIPEIYTKSVILEGHYINHYIKENKLKMVLEIDDEDDKSGDGRDI